MLKNVIYKKRSFYSGRFTSFCILSKATFRLAVYYPFFSNQNFDYHLSTFVLC